MNCSFSATCLQDLVLDDHADVPWLICPHDPLRTDDADRFSIPQLSSRALSCAAALRVMAPPRTPILLICENDASFVVAFFGILLAGMIPVPFPTPHFVENRAAYARKLGLVGRDCGAPVVLTNRALESLVQSEQQRTPRMVFVEDLRDHSTPDAVPARSAPSDTALIQYTSGSTGAPRGVELSHANILSNARGIGAAVDAGAHDVGVSWLPLFHDMGLIGSMLFTLAWGMPYVLLKPRTFLFRPASWLWTMSRFGGTLSPAPNFAYQLCVSRTSDASLQGLHLGSWRVAFNGSEMVHPDTVQAFSQRFGPLGFRGKVLPVYGLAENALAVSFAELGAPLRIDYIDREQLEQRKRAVAVADRENARPVVSVGRALAGQGLRVSDRRGRALPERAVGEVQVAGACVMKGYYRNPRATLRAFTRDRWLRTGDRGYVSGGELFLVGRTKDLIKRHGVSLDPVDIQLAVGSLLGVRTSGVAAFGFADPEAGTDHLVLAVETTVNGSKALRELRQEIMAAVLQQCRVRPDDVLFVKRGNLPRTTSGKVRNTECRRRFLSRELAVIEP